MLAVSVKVGLSGSEKTIEAEILDAVAQHL
jgi:hypothetical protein